MSKSKRPPSALNAAVFAQPKRTANQPGFKRDPINVAYTEKRNNAEDKAAMIRLNREFDSMFGVE